MAPFDVGLELGQQAGHQVDRAREFGNFLEVKRHSQVIFGRMQPHPRHRVFAGDIIRVIRLMLVPEQRQGNRCHHSPFDPKELVVAHPGARGALSRASTAATCAAGTGNGPASPPTDRPSDPPEHSGDCDQAL